MKFCAAFLIVLLIASPALAAPPSLFFSNEEMVRIGAEVQKKPHLFSALGKHQLHLGSILYYGPNAWTVWLQGEKWTPETSRPNLTILEVSATTVHLRVTPFGEQTSYEVTLLAHQSLNLLTGIVSEGR